VKSKLRASTVTLGLLTVIEHIALLYLAGAEIVIEHYYPSDMPLSPEMYYAFVGAVVVGIISAMLTFNAMRLGFASQSRNPVDMALRWTFVITFVALPVGILLAAPLLFMAAPLTVILPFWLGNYLARSGVCRAKSLSEEE
jgi:hypothetical protein